ncbi:MAG: DinB family protein [Spirochaetes bacterium]|jgi:uncharacterized damage-inducible protein DinB|nr:DinB family protein [Spirochaetota bacterium]
MFSQDEQTDEQKERHLIARTQYTKRLNKGQKMIELQMSILQLEANKNIVKNLLKNVSQEQAAWKPKKDRWSLLEVLNHLTDIETEDFRYNFNLILFEPSKDWPSFNEMEWITSRKYNERDVKASLQNFEKERTASINLLKDLKNPDLYSMHLGNGLKNIEMHAGDLIASWIGHDLFHIRQMSLLNWDILNKWSAPFTPEYSGFHI